MVRHVFLMLLSIMTLTIIDEGASMITHDIILLYLLFVKFQQALSSLSTMLIWKSPRKNKVMAMKTMMIKSQYHASVELKTAENYFGVDLG
jgi:hypothetical protein